jgi:uncharacterized protein (DUF2461 family)
MGCRRRHAHRAPRPFLGVTAAESAADIHDMTRRVRRAMQEAEILGLPDVRDRLGAALCLAIAHAARPAEVAGQGQKAESIGQHEVTPAT